MNNYLQQDIIEQVRHAADIVAVISDYVTLKKVGANYQALCPFHSEKTPSFIVNVERQIFKCFGCGKAGNVFHFLMAISSLPFPEAVKQVANRYNIPLPTIEGDYNKEQKQREDINQAIQWCCEFFQKDLAGDRGKPGREYLQKRRFQAETIDKFRLGFAPNEQDRLYQHAMRAGFTAEILHKAGVIAPSKRDSNGYYDIFRNRVMFPIWNTEGEVVAFGGRTLSPDGKPKYLNSPETPIFAKRKTLYALPHAKVHLKEKPYLIVMEGYTDVIMAHQCNFPQAVATLGTSLSDDHARMIHRYVENVILVYDGDPAGQSAMLRALTTFLSQGLMLKIAVIPDQLDPYDLLVERGCQSFADVIAGAKDFLDFQIDQISHKYDMKSTGGRRWAITELTKTVRQIPDTITQKLFVGRVAEVFKLPTEVVDGSMTEKPRQAPVSDKAIKSCQQNLQTDEEQFLLWVCINYPHKIAEIFYYYPPAYFSNDELRELAEHLTKRQNDESGEAMDVSSLSAQVGPNLGERLINVFYADYGPNLDEEEVEKRLHLIYKSASIRKSYTPKFGKLKDILATAAPQDEELKMKILQDARQMCKAKMHGHFYQRLE